jgi:hypothetical protein
MLEQAELPLCLAALFLRQRNTSRISQKSVTIFLLGL